MFCSGFPSRSQKTFKHCTHTVPCWLSMWTGNTLSSVMDFKANYFWTNRNINHRGNYRRDDNKDLISLGRTYRAQLSLSAIMFPHLFWRSRSAGRSRPPGGRSPRRIWSGGRSRRRWSAPARCCCSVGPGRRPFPKSRRGSRWSHTWRGDKSQLTSEVISCCVKMISVTSILQKKNKLSIQIIFSLMQQEGIKRSKEIKAEWRRPRRDKHRWMVTALCNKLSK